METIVKKIEESVKSEKEKFEKSPIKTGLKWFLILFFAKKFYNWFFGK
jgi:hypothetical protein